MQFERGRDPKATLGVGLRQKRVFKDVEEAAQWCAQWPGEYTDGFVEDWAASNPYNGKPFFDVTSGRMNGDALQLPIKKLQPGSTVSHITYGKLQMVKWIKENIHFDPWPQERIGLRECKAIADRMEEIVVARLLSDGRGPKGVLCQITDFIDELEKEDSALRRTIETGYAKDGWDKACYYIKQFIEGLK